MKRMEELRGNGHKERGVSRKRGYILSGLVVLMFLLFLSLQTVLYAEEGEDLTATDAQDETGDVDGEEETAAEEDDIEEDMGGDDETDSETDGDEDGEDSEDDTSMSDDEADSETEELGEDEAGDDDESDDDIDEEETLTEEEQPAEDVFQVTIPTAFEIPMFSTEEGIDVMGEDVVVCNEGDFPVDVTIRSVKVSIDRSLSQNLVRQARLPTDELGTQDLTEADKRCDLFLRLLLDGREAEEYAAPEGLTEDVVTFTLEEKQPDTDAGQLMEDKFADQVDSPDYAIVNFRGTATDGDGIVWKDGDLKAGITFSLARHTEQIADGN